jgi:hypothetical protein
VAGSSRCQRPRLRRPPSRKDHQRARTCPRSIRDGKIGVVVDGEFRNARNAVVDIADTANGIVLSSSIDGRSGTFVLRVPANQFDEVLTDLGGLGHVDYEEEAGRDVTAEYIDLGAHLTIYTERKALLEHLLSRATSIGEILALSGKVEDVQFRIEEIQGQLRYLNNQIAEATVRLELREKSAPDEAAAVADDVTRPSLGRAWRVSVRGFLNVVSAIIVGAGYLLPVGTIALIVWFTLAMVRRRERVTG